MEYVLDNTMHANALVYWRAVESMSLLTKLLYTLILIKSAEKHALKKEQGQAVCCHQIRIIQESQVTSNFFSSSLATVYSTPEELGKAAVLSEVFNQSSKRE